MPTARRVRDGSAIGAASSRMDLLRFATAGSVDDGKTTLIGRLLLRLQVDLRGPARGGGAGQRERGDEYTNLALLTDGLRAEREQGITIDVAYRYFATPRRKFIIADTPGHIQYTRNMVTGASTADLGRRPGRRPQGPARAVPPARLPRHAAAGARTWWSRVNKMDLVDYDEEVFERIARRVHRFAAEARGPRPRRSSRSRRCTATTSSTAPSTCRGTTGLPLLHHLEHVHIAARPQPGRRALPGAVRHPAAVARRTTTTGATPARSPAACSGPATRSSSCPSGLTTTIAAIDTSDGPVDEAFPPMSVTVRLGGRHRHLPRRHDLPAAQPARSSPRTSTPWSAGWTTRAAAGPAARLRHQAHHPLGPGHGHGTCTTGSTSTRCTATRTPTSSGSTRSAGSGCGSPSP